MSGPKGQSESAQILRFERPGARRFGAHSRAVGIPAYRPEPAVQDISRYEHSPEAPEDYRHRQKMNIATFVICAFLVVAGVWIAQKMADVRRDQDCVLAGRKNCAGLTFMGGDTASAYTKRDAAPPLQP